MGVEENGSFRRNNGLTAIALHPSSPIPSTANLHSPNSLADKMITEYETPTSGSDEPMKDICIDVMPVCETRLAEDLNYVFMKERTTPISVSSETELIKQKDDHKESPGQNAKFMLQENGDGSEMGSAISGELHLAPGETSFSATGVSPALISYSGSIPYSGNISHRSESSTTSTRSFAFPILQSDWNNSPVRMAKARRRHARKCKSWMQCLVCGRF